MKQRTIQFRVKTPEIEIAYSTPDVEYKLAFPFKQENIEGSISLELDSNAFGGWTPTNHSEGPEYVASTCDAIIIQVKGQSVDDFIDEIFLKIAHRLTVEHLSKLISFIGIELGQYWVHLGRLPEWKLNHFLSQTRATWVEDKKEISVFEKKSNWEMIEVFDSAPQPSEFYDRAVSINKIRWKSIYLYFLHEQFQPDLTKTLIANAKRYFESGDYRMAAIEAITALDVKLRPSVKRGLEKMPEREIDVWLNRIANAPKYSNAERRWTGESILEDCMTLNKIRNGIIHEGEEAKKSEVEIQQGIEASELLLGFIEAST